MGYSNGNTLIRNFAYSSFSVMTIKQESEREVHHCQRHHNLKGKAWTTWLMIYLTLLNPVLIYQFSDYSDRSSLLNTGGSGF